MTILSIFFGLLLLAIFKESTLYNGFVFFSLIAISSAFFFDLCHKKELKAVSVPLAIAYIFRLTLLLIDIYGRNYIHLPMSGNDTEMFYSTAIGYTEGISSFYGGVFPRLMGLLFLISGASRLWGNFIILLFSIGALVVFNRIMIEIQTSDYRRYQMMFIIGLLPNFAILSSIFLRESLICLLISLSVLFFVQWFTRDTPSELQFIMSFAFAILASLFHGASGTMVVGYIIIRMLYSKQIAKFSVNWKNLVVSIVFLFIFSFLFTRYGELFFNKITRANSLAEIATGTGRGSSSYAQYVGDSSTPLRMAIFTIPRILFYLFSPFPWQWRGISDIITFLFNSCFYIYVTVRAFNSLLKEKASNRSLLIALLIVGLCVTFVFSWGLSNTGTALRHRDKFVILFGVILSICSEKRKSRRYSPMKM